MPGPGSLDLYKPELKMEKRNICISFGLYLVSWQQWSFADV